MGFEFLIVIAVGFLWSGIGVVFSRVARRNIDYVGFMVLVSVLMTLATWLVFPRHRMLFSGVSRAEWNSGYLMLLAGLFYSAGMTLLNLGMQRGHHGATWTLGQSALVIPFLLGILLWGDRVRPWNFAGLVVVLIAIALFGRAGGNNTGPTGNSADRWLWIVLLSLVFLGIQQTLTTVPSRWENWKDLTRLRIPMLWTGSMIGYSGLCIGLKRKIAFYAWPYGIAFGAAALIASALLFHAIDLFAQSSRAALVYPAAVGTCTIVFSLYSTLVLREKSTIFHILGMATGIIGVILVSVR